MVRDKHTQGTVSHKDETGSDPKSVGYQVIYNSLTGKSYTRQELLRTLPVRLIAVFQPDGTLLVGPFNSEWMAKRWRSIVQRLEVALGNQHSAIVHLAGDNLDGQPLNEQQRRQLVAAVQAHLRQTAGH